jgi:predicted mannosyl-3-phosphoglycerate phosphatase (HAD superfamily)
VKDGELHVDQAFAISEQVLARRTGDEMVLLNLDNEQYYGLDEVGARFWAQIESGASFDQAVDALLDEYDVDRETLVVDLTALVEDLRQNGLVG